MAKTNLRRKSLSECMVLEREKSLVGRKHTVRSKHGTGAAESSHLEPQARNRESKLERAWVLKLSKPAYKWDASFKASYTS